MALCRGSDKQSRTTIDFVSYKTQLDINCACPEIFKVNSYYE